MAHRHAMHFPIAAAHQPGARHGRCVMPDPVGRMHASRLAMMDRSGGYRLRGWDRAGKPRNHSERKKK
jgi:hypothetical protein